MRFLINTLVAASIAASATAAPQMRLEKAERLPTPIIDEATPETALAVQQLQLPAGIEASLWAAEPMLANPVAFAFDEQGRLFVSETYRYRTSVLDIRGYMGMLEEDMAFRTVDDRAQGIIDLFGPDAPDFAIESEIVRLIEDRDGDGTADFSAPYADQFNSSLDGIASGVLARQGKVYFTNIPSLWELEGTDANGHAQARKELLRGFGVHFGYTGHDFHGLIIGPDGKLYFSIGDRGTHVERPEGGTVAYPDTGAVFRSNLDGTGLELVHSGLRNPQELAFDELGNLFTGDNDCDNGDYERLVQIAEGGDSGWRIGHQHAPLGGAGVWMSEGWWKTQFEGRAKFALPPISYIEDGPSGIAYYPGTGLSPDYAGHLFITHFKGSIATSGVYTYTMKPKGAWQELGEKKQFLKGVLPTDVTFAPDGKFYVLDWVVGWPKSNKGRVYALSNPEHQASEIVAQTKTLIAEGMSKRPGAELGQLLAHPNWNVRLEAQLELAKRGESSLPIFTSIATDNAAQLYSRLHATWGLGILAEHSSAAAKTTIVQLARSAQDEVRAQAAKLIGDHAIAGNEDLLISALTDTSSRVRYFAAQSLGKLGATTAGPALIAAARANADQDPYLSHAIVMGLVGAKNMGTLANAVTDDSKAVRFAALLAYRRLGDVNVARFLHDADKDVVFEAARAINDAPITGAYESLAAALDNPFASDPILANRAINAHFRLGKAANAAALARYAANESVAETLRLEALTQLASWPTPLQRDRIMGTFQPLPAHDAKLASDALIAVADKLFTSKNGTVQAAFIAAVNTLGGTGLADKLYAVATDENAIGSARVAAFNTLSKQGDPRMDQLVISASQSSASELRLATLPIVTERSPKQAAITLGLMVKGSVEEQRVAYKTLANSSQPFAVNLLVESLARLTADAVPHAAQLELIEAAEKHQDTTVQAAYQAYKTALTADPDPLAPFRYALEGGESGPGRTVFFNNQVMACVRCHVVYGPGDAAGPNLSGIGLTKDRRYLLESVVHPNATIAAGFDNVILTLADGTTRAGIIQAETDKQLTLALVSGETETIGKAKIKKRDAMPSSMPAIFDKMLTRKEIRDVVEFLTDQRTDITSGRSTHGE